ncbi:MAG: hypothetical protein H0Z33_06045 [Bacillaceae bacterium]|nr:hypothetical protein [Bacillaceae bacterium]
MNKKIIMVLSASLVLSGVLAGCGNENAATENDKPAEQEQAANNEETNQDQSNATEDKGVRDEVAAYQEIIELLEVEEGEAIDWDNLTTTYEEGLKQAVSAKSNEFDAALQAAMAGGKEGQLEPEVAEELIDKLIQSYFYQKQKSLHKDIVELMEQEQTDAAQQKFEELKYLVQEVMIPTASKRDQYYGTDMQTQIENGLSLQEQALNEGNADDFAVYKQITDKSIYRSYYLAAQSYAEKIEKAVQEGNADPTALKKMQAEAWGFYQAIKGSLSGGDEEAALTLNDWFDLSKTNPEDINAEQVSQLFVKAFVGKILSYHEKAPKALEEGDLRGARGSALEGNTFLKAIELALIEKLGQDETDQLFDKAEKWYKAIENENGEEAKPYSDEITTALKQMVQ